MKIFKLCSLPLALSLAACGGGSSSGGGSSQDSQLGIFTDSAVAGISYQTSPGGKSGKTSALGEYTFVDGDSVVFSIGGIALPEVSASGRVTPADMSSADNADQVTNILRLLQSMDDDGNPDNGINISDDIHAALAEAQLNLGQSAQDFEAQFDTEVASATSKTLVSAAAAEAHFNESQQADLRGSWLFIEPAGESSNGKGPDGEEVNVLTFLSGNRYIVTHKYGNEDQGAATAEWGSYDWNPASGEITFSTRAQTDNEGGFCETTGQACGQETVHLVGDELHFASEADAATPFQAVKNAENAFVGSWLLEDDGENFHVLTILNDGSYSLAHNYRDEGDSSLPAEAPTAEWGEYRIDSGALTVTKITDETDGDGGLSDADDRCRTSLLGDLDCESENEDPFSFMRVGRFAVELSMKDDDGNIIYEKTATVERSSEVVFVENQAKSFSYQLPEDEASIEVQLNANGGGTVTFGPDESSTIDPHWAVSAAGTLEYDETMEDNSTGHWAFAPITDSRGREIALIRFSHLDGDTEHLNALFISELDALAKPQ